MNPSNDLGPVSYPDYLKLDQLLACQDPRSQKTSTPAHEELLFIITHQTYELWFKQILHDLKWVQQAMGQQQVDESQMGAIVSKLDRVVVVLRLLNQQVDVLETMTPLEFLEFRHLLYPASGFQSGQWRAIEAALGLKASARLTYNGQSYLKSLSDTERALLEKAESEPSIRDLTDKWLSRMPVLKYDDFDFTALFRSAVETMLKEDEASVRAHATTSEAASVNLAKIESIRDSFNALFDESSFNQMKDAKSFHFSYRAIHAALLVLLYRDQPLFQLPFQYLSRLQDIDELMTTWRYRHALMASRMLGQKIGTGGSSGHDYLSRATESHRVMSDLNKLSTFLIPKSRLPQLPESVTKRLKFSL